jgi:hypothetical protein
MTEGRMMPKISNTDGNPRPDAAMTALAKLQQSGFGSIVNMSTEWIETLSSMGAEITTFAAERIKEDVQTQQKIMQCKNMTEVQRVQAKFIQKALNQYQEETGKLIEMSTKAFAPKERGDKT